MADNPQARRWPAVLLVLSAGGSFGLLSPMIKIVYGYGYDAVAVSASQIAAGAALIWLILLLRPGLWSNPFRGPWIQLSLVGIFGLALSTFLINGSLEELDASIAIVLLFQFTWMSIILDSALRRRWPGRRQWLAMGLVLFGTWLAVNLLEADFTTLSVKGVLLGLGAALCYSVFLIWTGRLNTGMHPIMKAAVMLTAALPVLFALYPPQTVFQGEGAAVLLAWGLLLGLLGQVLPTICLNAGLPKLDGSLGAILASVELPVAVAGAYLILGEQVGFAQWAGIILILAGIVLAEKKAAETYR